MLDSFIHSLLTNVNEILDPLSHDNINELTTLKIIIN